MSAVKEMEQAKYVYIAILLFYYFSCLLTPEKTVLVSKLSFSFWLQLYKDLVFYTLTLSFKMIHYDTLKWVS